MDANKNKRHPYWVGAFSVLDLSGDYKPFAYLVDHCRSVQRNSWGAIGRDFEATGQYLHNAIVASFENLPREQQVELIHALRERIAEEDSQYDCDQLVQKRVSSYLRRYLTRHQHSIRRNEEKEKASVGL